MLQMEEKVKEIVDIKQRTLAEENQKTLEVLKERERLLQEQLRAAKESVSNMQKLHEFGQSQLFEFRAQSEEEEAARQSELNLLTDEVERAQSRLLSLEREKHHGKGVSLIVQFCYYNESDAVQLVFKSMFPMLEVSSGQDQMPSMHIIRGSFRKGILRLHYSDSFEDDEDMFLPQS
eukprot:Gb_08469 [translate_table: standard]